ncbi:MAG: PHP domain-containing protein [Richelia sp. RM2_1_2]|nr:PHP domain-containing protein [Richelia sp. RM2_1_2]
MSTFQPVIPIFSTDHSVGDSILTVNKESTTKYPISVLAIAKTHKLKKIVVVDSNFSSFWQLYRNAKDLEVDFIYGQKIRICADINQKDENSIKTESNVIVIAKNSEGYSDLIQLYSQGRHGFYYVPRIDWNILNKFYTENLIILIPFYSSFLAYNTLRLNYCANPSFSSFTPVF